MAMLQLIDICNKSTVLLTSNNVPTAEKANRHQWITEAITVHNHCGQCVHCKVWWLGVQQLGVQWTEGNAEQQDGAAGEAPVQCKVCTQAAFMLLPLAFNAIIF